MAENNIENNKNIPIGIIGAGAMGTLFSCFFQRAGFEVSCYDNCVSDQGPHTSRRYVMFNDHEEAFDMRLSSSPHILRECLAIFIFVKSYSTHDALHETHKYIGDQTTVISLQNGLGNIDSISNYINLERIIYGTTTYGATRLSEDRIRFGGDGIIQIGGKDKDRIGDTSTILEKSGLSFEITPEPDRAQWEKAIVNAAINPLAALLEITNGELMKNQFTINLQKDIICEAIEAAKTQGHVFDKEKTFAKVEQICRMTASNRCSMLQDLSAGQNTAPCETKGPGKQNAKKTEIDSINGMIIEYSRRSKISVPVNETVYKLVKSKEIL